MTDSKDELKRGKTRPILTIASAPQQKEKKVIVQDDMDLSEEKEIKGLGRPSPTVSAGYIQNLVLHPMAERDPDRVGPHYAPCPPPTGGDIARDRAINEWVLNHLPLTEEQKMELIHRMNIEHRKNQMLDESLTMRSKNLQALKAKEVDKAQEEEEKDKGHRLGVKDKSKGRSCSACSCS